MSREEAIKELTELLPEDFLSEYAEAIRMAIKALEQESTEMTAKEVDYVKNSRLAIEATQRMSCKDEDIAMAFQLGLLFGKADKAIEESKEEQDLEFEVRQLRERVETLEKHIKEDKEELLKKLEAELAYAKFRCTL